MVAAFFNIQIVLVIKIRNLIKLLHYRLTVLLSSVDSREFPISGENIRKELSPDDRLTSLYTVQSRSSGSVSRHQSINQSINQNAII